MANDSDSEAEADAPPENVDLPEAARENMRGPKAAQKEARQMAGETRVVTIKRGGHPSSCVCKKQRDRNKGGVNVKVFGGR